MQKKAPRKSSIKRKISKKYSIKLHKNIKKSDDNSMLENFYNSILENVYKTLPLENNMDYKPLLENDDDNIIYKTYYFEDITIVINFAFKIFVKKFNYNNYL